MDFDADLIRIHKLYENKGGRNILEVVFFTPLFQSKP
jgi:hypothetical protein